MNELWNEIARRAGITLSEAQHALLSRYLDLLMAGNQRMNLTRITDRAAAEVGHVGDALTVLEWAPKEVERIVDVGSGGGVPGIPLAIARPAMKVTLLEATKKKAEFLRQTVDALGLLNVNVVALRAEEAGVGEMRESYDVAMARAVATIDWLAEWCLPLVKNGGKVLLMKGPKHAEELPKARKAIRQLGGGEPVVHPVSLPEARGLVIVEIPKVGKTDKRYPRAASVAKGQALG